MKPALSPQQCSRCHKRLGPQAVRAAQMQFHSQCFFCDVCKKPLSGAFQHKNGRIYHAECFEKLFAMRCKHCGESIQGAYQKDDSGRYHAACYQELHQLYCCLCQQGISGSYLSDLWGNKACSQHGQIATGQCHVCARLMSSETGKTLPDGRLLCAHCQPTEIEDFRQIQAAKLEALRLMKAVGFAYIPDYVKVELYSDQQLINQRLQASATGNIHGYTRSAQRHIPNYGLLMEHSIHILNGLPRIAFMGVVAHELLHVWIHEQGLQHLTPPQVEGFCNLGTGLIYQAEPSELASVLQQRMLDDPDPVYGDGYRLMKAHLEQKGWPALIQAMTQPGALDILPKSILVSPVSVELPAPAQAAAPAKPVLRAPQPSANPAASLTRTVDPDAASKLAEIKARVQAKMQQGRQPQAPSTDAKLKKLNKKRKHK